MIFLKTDVLYAGDKSVTYVLAGIKSRLSLTVRITLSRVIEFSKTDFIVFILSLDFSLSSPSMKYVMSADCPSRSMTSTLYFWLK